MFYQSSFLAAIIAINVCLVLNEFRTVRTDTEKARDAKLEVTAGFYPNVTTYVTFGSSPSEIRLSVCNVCAP